MVTGAGVRVRCFGALRDRLGAERLVPESVASVEALWAVLTRDAPELREARQHVRVARNFAYCDWGTALEPGDEIAFMPPVAGGSADARSGPSIRTALIEEPIDAGLLAAELRSDADGAVATFVGVVRGESEGSAVSRLDYEAYPEMAERELRRVAEEIAGRHQLSGLTLVHRVGSLAVGETSVAVVAAAPHRGDALEACREGIEMVKRDLPVWKREHRGDGAVWVDARELAPPPAGAGGPAPTPSPSGGTETGPRLTHVDGTGGVRMVDVSQRAPSLREATAEAAVRFSTPIALRALREGSPKGDVLATARLAGIMGAKRTPELIPLCHPLPITHLDVRCEPDEALPGVRITATARCVAATGVEMEALTAAAIASLTVIDMLKAVDPWIAVDAVQLLAKSGGRSGSVRRPGNAGASLADPVAEG
jgi:cyclic pyranopterin phosphate synthase